jgi:hypothetical protein
LPGLLASPFHDTSSSGDAVAAATDILQRWHPKLVAEYETLLENGEMLREQECTSLYPIESPKRGRNHLLARIHCCSLRLALTSLSCASFLPAPVVAVICSPCLCTLNLFLDVCVQPCQVSIGGCCLQLLPNPPTLSCTGRLMQATSWCVYFVVDGIRGEVVVAKLQLRPLFIPRAG